MKLKIETHTYFPFMLTPAYKVLTECMKIENGKPNWFDMIMVFSRNY